MGQQTQRLDRTYGPYNLMFTAGVLTKVPGISATEKMPDVVERMILPDSALSPIND